jgi:8-oxo-dGTP pyrophosphatase MutT (NUDIX family)
MTKHENSAGGVVYKKLQVTSDKSQVFWLLGKHSGYHKWVLPKGLIESGETSLQAALREVEEEMGVKAKALDDTPIHKVEYSFMADYGEIGKSFGPERRVAIYEESGGKQMRVEKQVEFFLMEYVSGDIKDKSWEMEDVGWYSYDEAMGLLAFEGEKEALKIANDKISAR